MMDLDEAIKHAEEVANTNERLCETVRPAMQLSDYGKCAEEHRQLAEWLKELKAYRENTCGDAISREELIEALNTWDKFGYAPTNELISLRGNADKDKYVPYIHWDDVLTCIRNMPSVTPQPKGGNGYITMDIFPTRMSAVSVANGLVRILITALTAEQRWRWKDDKRAGKT